ncbi:N-acetylmuramoyl-L-alanine amidase [bacterium]|nr:N-acetylmuramoyl-L-alanine amidase [bacterium]
MKSALRFLAAPVLVAGLVAGCATQQPFTPPTVVSAAQWGSKPHEFPESYRQTPKMVLIHHAGEMWKAGSDPEQKLRNLQTWGFNEKKWMDVPYHFLISPDGRIFEGRSVDFKPDTNTNFDTTGYINVQLWGNFEEQRVTLAQLKSVVGTTAMLIDRYDMPKDAFTTHKDVAEGQTSCPGKDFHRYIESGLFKQWVEDSLKGKTPAIELLPPLEGGPTEMTPE